MNEPYDAFSHTVQAGEPGHAKLGPTLRSAIADLYGVIAVLDSAQQSDFAGRLHALTLELRERVSDAETLVA